MNTLPRRTLLLTFGVGVHGLFMPLNMLAASNVWDKDPAKWSENDIFLLSTKSPWAKLIDPEVRIQPGEGRGGANDAAERGRSARGSGGMTSSGMATGGMGNGMEVPLGMKA